MFEFVVFGFVALGFAALVGGLIWWILWLDKKRTEALQMLAVQIGFTFNPDAGPESLPCSGLDLFQRGRARKVKNLMRRREAGAETLLFDYRYTTGSGKNSNTWHQTVVALEKPGASMPSFGLQAENVIFRLISMLGYQDIDFDEDPEFSNRFNLRGQNVEAVRSFFTAERRAAVCAGKPFNLEGAGDWLIAYRPSRPLKPEEIPSFLEEVRTVAASLVGEKKNRW